jgi:hypothetical protein
MIAIATTGQSFAQQKSQGIVKNPFHDLASDC